MSTTDLQEEETKDIIAAFDFDGTLTMKDTMILFIRFTHGQYRLFLGFLRYIHLLLLMKLGLCPNWKVKEKIFTHFYKGTTYEQFKQWGHRFTDFVEPMLNRQMVDTLKRHQAEGHTVCVVTASIDEWVHPVCERLGVSMLLATCIEVSANGTLTGRFLSPRSDMPLGSSKNCYGAEKVARLLEAYPQRQTYKLYAYGNSRGDREMLALADESFVIMQKWKSPTP